MKVQLPEIQPELEIITRRALKYPQKSVFAAWSNGEQLKNWWGPNGFTNTFEVFDFRPGGRWKFVMHGPDKGNYNNEVEFIAIDEPNFIYWKRHSKPLFRIAVNFEAHADQATLVTLQNDLRHSRRVRQDEKVCGRQK